MTTVSITILDESEYVHVVNTDDGRARLVEGPKRFVLASNEEIHGDKRKKITVRENQYVIILNPWDEKEHRCILGEREVRSGPVVFSLHPGELQGGPIKGAHVLTNNEALFIQATDAYDTRCAGEKWRVDGPCVFIPTKYDRILSTVSTVNVGPNKGIYVRDTRTSRVQLVRGPVSYMLSPHEELWPKPFSNDEYEALGIPKVPTHWATVVELQKGECLCVVNYGSHKEKFVRGPDVYMLHPEENVKVLSLSAGVPKRENVRRAAAIRLGPDFMFDQFAIRTKDNAVLKIQLSYRWEFVVGALDLHLPKVFAIDFIGYTCQHLRSRIREEAAKHNFEDFHNRTAEILRSCLFKEIDLPITDEKGDPVHIFARFFPECTFLITEVDVKVLEPMDEEISELLNESLRSNMKILCKKLEDSANLQAEKERIQSSTEIATVRRTLIERENINLQKTKIETAKIEGQALIEKAKAEAEALEILERSKMTLELKEMAEHIDALQSHHGRLYLELLRGKGITSCETATVVPEDMKTLFLPNFMNPSM